jgi:hypothetical protein
VRHDHAELKHGISLTKPLTKQVFERLMRMCVMKMHVYMGIYLQLKQHVDTQAPRKINPQLSARWKRVSLVVKGYVKAMVKKKNPQKNSL